LSKLDLRLPGNPLEGFVHDHANHFATISCLTDLDLTGCGKRTISILIVRMQISIE